MDGWFKTIVKAMIARIAFASISQDHSVVYNYMGWSGMFFSFKPCRNIDGMGVMRMNSKKLRMVSQFGFLAFLTWTGFRHQLLGGGPGGAPAVDALCPFGGVEALYSLLTSGVWLRRLAPSAMVLLVMVLVLTLILGRVFCGWICPLGTIGEWTSRLGSRLGFRKRELPLSIDRPLRYLKYAVLAAIVLLTWKMGTLVWRDMDPWVAWMHLSAGWPEMVEKPLSYAALFLLVIGASLFVERFWCRYLCPLGALLGPIQKISLFRVRRKDDTCVHCHRCGGECPVRLDPESSKSVASAECIACGRCVEACPVQNTLFFGFARWRISVLLLGVATLAIFFGGYGAARITGLWATYAPPSQVTTSFEATESIYGWMTLNQMAETLGIPVETVLQLGELDPALPLDIPVKEIDGVDDEELREKLAESLESAETFAAAGKDLPSPQEIRGSMTMEEIAGVYGLDGKQVFLEAGWPEDSDQTASLKDLAAPLGMEVSTVRDAVEKMLDEKP